MRKHFREILKRVLKKCFVGQYVIDTLCYECCLNNICKWLNKCVLLNITNMKIVYGIFKAISNPDISIEEDIFKDSFANDDKLKMVNLKVPNATSE